ncbi:hypothetical protein GEMRC1_001431 [Eukaryota sp. GEM-RC1]
MFNNSFPVVTQDDTIPASQASTVASQQFDFFDFGTQSQSQSQVDFTNPSSELTFFDQDDSSKSSSSKSRQLGKAPRSRGLFLPLDDSSSPAMTSQVKDICAYCSLAEPSCLAQCDCCKKWFCNSKLGSSGSHIVNHLVRSKHKEITLHPSSPLGDTVLECYSCGCKNIFLLGFVPAKGENIVVLLCREPCLSRTKNPDWSLDKWLPLISDKSLLPWVLRPPTVAETEQSKVSLLSSAQANALEQLWNSRPEATLTDLVSIQKGDGLLLQADVSKVPLSFEDGLHYDHVFSPLVQLEADNDRKVKESQSASGITVRWENTGQKHRLACFHFPSFSAESELRLVPGDELKLRYAGDGRHAPWSCIGHVLRFNPNDEIVVELKPGHACSTAPVDCSIGFTADFVWKSTSFDRMVKALARVANSNKAMTPSIKTMLLGHEAKSEPINVSGIHSFSAPNLPELNPSQQQAVRAVLSSPLPISMIQGPPGTGKTLTSASLVYYLVQLLNKNPGKNTFVMVCAPSNVAADQLTEKIHLTGVPVVRIFAKSRESIASSVEHLALHNVILQVEAERNKSNQTPLAALTQLEARARRVLKVAAEREVLRNTKVIVTTCVGAGDPRLRGCKFRYVLVDEATAATEPETLIPIVSGATKVILVGDHCQLGPVVMSKDACQAGLSQSMYERLVLLGYKPSRLQIQYRMHPILAEFPSDTFYEGTLQNGVTALERQPSREHGTFPWIDPSLPLLSASGTSYLNRTEASFVEKVVTEFLKTGATPDQIGVITPYEGQRSFICAQMQRNGPLHSNLYRDVEVASVDSFQGREKDYIVLSCVRSNEHSSIGFLNSFQRLNVALTRAKYGVVIIGNPRVLSRNVLWNNLLSWYKRIGCFVEGPLNNLRKSNISFPKAKSFIMDKRYTPTSIINELKLNAAPPAAAATPTTEKPVESEGEKKEEEVKADKQWSFAFSIPSTSSIPELPTYSFDAGATDLFDLDSFQHTSIETQSQGFELK